MASFAVFKSVGAAQFDLNRVDINVWVLPSLVRRETFLVDFGIKLTLRSEASKQTPIKMIVGVPFPARDKKIYDLVPSMVNDTAMCALVFGASDIEIVSDENGTWIADEHIQPDGSAQPGRMLFVPLDDDRCREIERSKDGSYSQWEICIGDREIASGSSVYLRFRFSTHSPGRVWDWQRGFARNSHAISDLRVNEFRSKPDLAKPPNYATDVLSPERVNGFIIASSVLKAGRVSPQPKYVRVLENASWEPYLGRRLGRRREVFLITYWTRNSVSQGSPFRSFMEVERRRPTAVKAVTVATAVLLLALLVLQSWWQIRHSVAGEAVTTAWARLWPVISTLGVIGLLRVAWTQLRESRKRFEFALQAMDRFDVWWYRNR